MKMPEKLDEKLLAPCGINCLVCYRYCAGARKPCPGCRYDGEGNRSIAAAAIFGTAPGKKGGALFFVR